MYYNIAKSLHIHEILIEKITSSMYRLINLFTLTIVNNQDNSFYFNFWSNTTAFILFTNQEVIFCINPYKMRDFVINHDLIK